MFASFSRFAAVGMLLVAALLVAVAILTSGAVSRGINGAGGVLWLIGLVMIWRALGRGNRSLRSIVAALAMSFVLVLLVKPSDLLSAAIGFGVAGVIIGLVARRREVLWAAMIPALWLPVHLSIAISRAVLDLSSNQAAVRADPPPTEAFVPFMMVVAALAGGLAVRAFRQSRVGSGMTERVADRPETLDRA